MNEAMLDLELQLVEGMNEVMDLEGEIDHRLVGHQIVAVHKVGTFGCNLLELKGKPLDSLLD